MELIRLGHGSVTFNPSIPPIPFSERTEGMVTITNNPSPGRAAFFETAFTIMFTEQVHGADATQTLHLRVVCPAQDDPPTYKDVEKSAALSLPAMLREMADLIETELRTSAD
jgi:hypothetical protein